MSVKDHIQPGIVMAAEDIQLMVNELAQTANAYGVPVDKLVRLVIVAARCARDGEAVIKLVTELEKKMPYDARQQLKDYMLANFGLRPNSTFENDLLKLTFNAKAR